MRNSYLRLLVIFLAWVPTGVLLAQDVSKSGVKVSRVWARATPQGAPVGAAYLSIQTDDKTSDTLLSVATPVAGRAELHSSTMEGGIMKMRRLDKLELKPGTIHELKPMGDHLMLMQLKEPLKQGDVLKLTLTFEKAGMIEIEGPIAPVGANGPPSP